MHLMPKRSLMYKHTRRSRLNMICLVSFPQTHLGTSLKGDKRLKKILFSFEGVTLKGRKKNPVAMALRNHLYPYRTQKLSSIALMVLGGRPPGRVERCRIKYSSIAQLAGQTSTKAPGRKQNIKTNSISESSNNFTEVDHIFLDSSVGRACGC